MGAEFWQVWIGDLRGSKKIAPEARARASRHLDESIQATVQRYRVSFKLRPAVLRGDEIQAVLTPDAPTLTILTYLRAQLAVRGVEIQEVYAGIGLGAIPVLHPRNPFESDGPAFHLARRALDSLKDKKYSRMLTAWITENPAFDDAAKAMLPLFDTFFSRWTREQWEAIVYRLQGSTLKAIGEELGVAGQAAHKRLHVARWKEVANAVEYLESRHPGRLGLAPNAATTLLGTGERPRKGEAPRPRVGRKSTSRG
jgi:hypothetical protein